MSILFVSANVNTIKYISGGLLAVWMRISQGQLNKVSPAFLVQIDWKK